MHRPLHHATRHLVATLLLLALVAAPPPAGTEDPPQPPPLRPLHDTFVFLPEDVVAGTDVALRVLVTTPASLTDDRPIEGATVRIALEGAPGGTLPLFEGKTDARGLVTPRVRFPEVPDGKATLWILTVSPFGHQDITQELDIRAARSALLLTTDKPLYQPGQVVHLRALALREGSLKPAAAADLVFEIADPKGNKVMKRTVRTSDFGVAATDFTLADEVGLGDYDVSAAVGPAVSRKTVVVKKYVLPRFRTALTTVRAFHLPGDTLQGEVQADYLFGRPVAGAEVAIEAACAYEEFSASEHARVTHDFSSIATVSAQTDAHGHATFEVPLAGDLLPADPAVLGGQLRLQVAVTDGAGHTERTIRVLPVARGPIGIAAVPESGRLVPGVENLVYLVATYPDGTPAPDAEVEFVVRPRGADGQSDPPDDGDDPIGVPPLFSARARTDATGIATVAYTPRREHLGRTDSDYEARVFPSTNPEDRGREHDVRVARVFCALRARDARGAKCESRVTLPSQEGGPQLLLRLDRAIYAPGEPIGAEVFTTAGPGGVYVDLLKDGQTVAAALADVHDGRARCELAPPPGLAGAAEVHAYQLAPSGDLARDGQVAYVRPAGGLTVAVTADKPEYRPGEAAVVRFAVTDAAGRPAPAALGVVLVDESVYALQENQPGLERAFFTLTRELAAPAGSLRYAGPSLAELAAAPGAPPDRQRIARVLLAGADPCPYYAVAVNPRSARTARVVVQYRQVCSALADYVRSGEIFSARDEATGQWGFRKDLLDLLVTDQKIDPAWLRTPWSRRVTLADLAQVMAGFDFEATARAAYQQRKDLLWHKLLEPREGEDAGPCVLERAPGGDTLRYRAGVLEALPAAAKLPVTVLTDPWGAPITLERLLREEPAFAPANLARAFLGERKRVLWPVLVQHVAAFGLDNLAMWDARAAAWTWRPDALARIVQAHRLDADPRRDACGRPVELSDLAAVSDDKAFLPEAVAHLVLFDRLRAVEEAIGSLISREHLTLVDEKTQASALPADLLARATGPEGTAQAHLRTDPWGHPLRLVPFEKPKGHSSWLDFYALTSDGPDRTPGTPDDLVYGGVNRPPDYHGELDVARVTVPDLALGEERPEFRARESSGYTSVAFGTTASFSADGDKPRAAGSPVGDPVRVRENFPETLCWQPNLLTDDRGEATLPLEMADSITTWRLTASASSQAGLLGGAGGALRVFSDFFVDIDFPVALTQGDEVAVPIAIHNYLSEPQTVRLEAQGDPADPWFELLDPPVREVAVAAGQVTGVRCRLRARAIGTHRLTVVARGTRMNDAVKRSVEVLPCGQRIEEVVNERLTGRVAHTFRIPERALAGSYQLVAKAYPGIHSQVLEGIDGLLGAPHG